MWMVSDVPWGGGLNTPLRLVWLAINSSHTSRRNNPRSRGHLPAPLRVDLSFARRLAGCWIERRRMACPSISNLVCDFLGHVSSTAHSFWKTRPTICSNSNTTPTNRPSSANRIVLRSATLLSIQSSDGLVRLLVGDWHGSRGLPIDPFQNTFVASSEESGFSPGIISTRRRQNSRQPGGFVGCEIRGFRSVTGRSFSAITCPTGDVEVQPRIRFFVRCCSSERVIRASRAFKNSNPG